MLAKEACQCPVPACEERGAMGAHQQGDDDGQTPTDTFAIFRILTSLLLSSLSSIIHVFFDIKQVALQDGSHLRNSLNFFIIPFPYNHLQQPYLVVLACY